MGVLPAIVSALCRNQRHAECGATKLGCACPHHIRPISEQETA